MSIVEHEFAFLGACIFGESKHLDVDLEPADFSDARCAKMWAIMQKMPIVEIMPLARMYGDESLISDIMDRIPSATSIQREAKHIRIAAYRRRLSMIYERASKAIANLDSDISQINTAVVRAIDNIAEDREAVSIHALMTDAYNDIEKAQTEGARHNFCKTGYATIDEGKIGGLQKDGLVIVAGRPSMGKSAFAVNVARNISLDKSVLMVSLEMPGKQLAMRMLAAEKGVDLQRMMNGQLDHNDWRCLADAVHILSDSKMFVNDLPSRTIQSVCAETRRFKRIHDDLGLVVIDYLGLLNIESKHGRKVDDISEVTRKLQNLSRELKCPVMLLCQLNRDLEKRAMAEKRPKLADLRDSGSIEQDADQVVFPFRPYVYDKCADEGYAEIIFAKNRNGPIGLFKMGWDSKCTKFFDDHNMRMVKWPSGSRR